MAAILLKAWQGYKFLFEDLTDPRTNTWFLVAKPYQGLAIIGLYLLFVLKWGPNWMKNRKPFNLDRLLIYYNAFQVVVCAYLFYAAVIWAWGWNYKWICEPVDYSNSEDAIRVARHVHFYFLLKVLDLLDTVFFILRKKFNQISFLHVYHHTGMVLLSWGGSTYFAGGHGTFIGLINSFVHVVMYSYYLLTVVKPSLKNSVWWKKYITQLQIIQFFWLTVHMALSAFKSECKYPRWISAVFLPQNLFMLILFVDFYIRNYIKKPKTLQNGSKIKVERNETTNNKLTMPGIKSRNGHANNVYKSSIKNGVTKNGHSVEISKNGTSNGFTEIVHIEATRQNSGIIMQNPTNEHYKKSA